MCQAALAYAEGETARYGTLLDDYTNKVVIISTNDVHGELDRYQYVAGLRNELENRNAGPDKYQYYSDKNGTKSIKAPVNAGNYFYKAYIPEDDESYSAVESNIAAVTIGRASAKIKAIKPSRKKVKRGKTYKLTVTKTKGSGKVTYKKVKGTKHITVSKSGKVKVGKKCKKGKTYTIKVRAVAAQNRNFNSAKRVQKVKVVVK